MADATPAGNTKDSSQNRENTPATSDWAALGFFCLLFRHLISPETTG